MRPVRFAIGDVHGCYDVLKTLVKAVSIPDDERIVLLGDFVDRGPDSMKVLDWVIDRTQSGRCIPLRGNHDAMMHAAITGRLTQKHWELSGGRETISSYLKGGGSSSKSKRLAQVIPRDHQDFLESGLLPYWETETHIFVHGGLIENVPVDQQDDFVLYWERFDRLLPHCSGKTIVCGHTAQKSGVPNDRGFAVCIDTKVFPEGWLTCLNVETGQYWQANRKGKIRTDYLPSMQKQEAVNDGPEDRRS
ncbi:Serine/threonine-protein phosphatase 1 [Thalassoglobus neptunius]|uniref:Serine/threonine-protein phosphatase 1 n=1 Tax=Thalassoglobus neptunius TaxID=1938619 RepID=A0A5C5WJE9_9PLAN|nr:metallophosphoesterase family protein [Thalassoglobus neptunius]TWT50103.1 Serine/threonine-protein phosphatase 1 [Thalassoglobus neptunius]